MAVLLERRAADSRPYRRRGIHQAENRALRQLPLLAEHLLHHADDLVHQRIAVGLLHAAALLVERQQGRTVEGFRVAALRRV